jgi:hypothetical protein
VEAEVFDSGDKDELAVDDEDLGAEQQDAELADAPEHQTEAELESIAAR